MTDDAIGPEGLDELPAEVAPPTAVGPGPAAPPPTPREDGDVALLGLIDRLASLLDRSDLTELEVESGGTALVLRKPAALAPAAVSVDGAAAAAPAVLADRPSAAADAAAVDARPSVKAPLTGIFYASPAPGSAPYVAVGREVAVGQVIGLIEAMKLFNEIKSDLAGRVVRVVPESGTLVKAKQPLIEVEPL
jgi:acetyl-CoA carboxylase biotin carboxyl carrier protein